MKFAHDLGQVWHTNEDQKRAGIVGICDSAKLFLLCEGPVEFVGFWVDMQKNLVLEALSVSPRCQLFVKQTQLSKNADVNGECSAVGKPQIWQPLTPLLTSRRRERQDSAMHRCAAVLRTGALPQVIPNSERV